MSVGENIKKIRLEKGLTQKQLGELCDPQIAESTIRRYELGRLNPKLTTLRRIKDALSVTLSELVDDWSIYSTGEFSKDWELTHEPPREIHHSSNTLHKYEKQKPENDPFLNKMDSFRSKLNDNGQDKAIEQVELLTKIPEYQKEPEE